jgi:predicted transcriptional regulator
MGKKRAKRQVLSEQLREIIEGGPVTRYRISKETGIDASQLCRFVKGKGDMSLTTLDKIGELLRLRFVQDDDCPPVGRPTKEGR